jgi:hypothetical protein
MKKLDKILEDVKIGAINTIDAKEQVLDLFVVMCSVCKTPINLKGNIVYDPNDEPCHKICYREHYT